MEDENVGSFGNLGLAKILGGESNLPITMDDDKKREVISGAYNTLILGLRDRVLREVSRMKLAEEV